MELAKYQPCGCIVCTCEENEENRCMGCGAKHCGNHPVGQFPNPLYLPTDRVMTREEYKGMRDRFRAEQGLPPAGAILYFKASWEHFKAGFREMFL